MIKRQDQKQNWNSKSEDKWKYFARIKREDELKAKVSKWNHFRNMNSKLGNNTAVIKWSACHKKKQLFLDKIRVRYVWELNWLRDKGACSGNFNLQHALSCKTSGFISISYKQIRNKSPSLLSKICKDVTIEPIL